MSAQTNPSPQETDAKRVKISIQNHVAVVALARPDKSNALDPLMFRAITNAAETLSQNTDVRAVVIHGEGKHFCAGLDFQSFQSLDANAFQKSKQPTNHPVANNFQKPAYLWKELPVPVIAALHGAAFGGGCQIALGADIRIAHPLTKMRVMEVVWGLVPDMAISQTLTRLVPQDVAMELVCSGRPVNAQEALQLHLITRIEENPLNAALALAQTFAALSPDAVRRCKTLVQNAWLSSPKDGLALEALLQSEVIGKPNQLEAVNARLNNQTPKFLPPKIT